MYDYLWDNVNVKYLRLFYLIFKILSYDVIIVSILFIF